MNDERSRPYLQFFAQTLDVQRIDMATDTIRYHLDFRAGVMGHGIRDGRGHGDHRPISPVRDAIQGCDRRPVGIDDVVLGVHDRGATHDPGDDAR